VETTKVASNVNHRIWTVLAVEAAVDPVNATLVMTQSTAAVQTVYAKRRDRTAKAVKLSKVINLKKIQVFKNYELK
jgi:hypothetical protein